jgi:hypothetical protein
MIQKLLTTILIMLPLFAMASPTAKFTILVVDSHGVPIQGADARISLMVSKSTGWGGKTYFVSGKTNNEGLFTGEGETQAYATYSASADGYYGTGIKFDDFTGVSGILGFRKWQPWNPILKVVLKKIKNPIAMYAYQTGRIEISKNDGFFGYDLVKGDWVSPHGKGITSDFLFKLEYLDMGGGSVTQSFILAFSNAADGIQAFKAADSQGSQLISSHHAPSSAYKNILDQKIVWESGKGTTYSSYKKGDGTNYYFRVRCDGEKLDTCLYGKIYENIRFDSETLSLNYYLNPSQNDTNVEFEREKNLFKNLDYKVTRP